MGVQSFAEDELILISQYMYEQINSTHNKNEKVK